MRVATLALLAALAAPSRAQQAPVEAVPADLAQRSLDDLWAMATRWEVGSNRDVVPAARQELVRRGAAALDYVVPAKLDTKDTLVTRALSVVVTGLGREAALPRLLPQLESPVANVRRNAADLLGALGAKEAAPALARLLSDPDARLGALSALGALKDPSAVPAIAALLRSDAPERVRCTAAMTLGQVGGAEAEAALAAHLAARDAPGRFAAQYALEQAKAVGTLASALRHEDQRVLLHALSALGRIGDASARAAVLPFSSDERAVVRGFAAEALGSMMDDATRTALEARLATEVDPFARGKLEAALAR